MKRLIFYPLFFLNVIGFSQTNNFAPIQSKWWYNYNDGPGLGYTVLEVEKDSLFFGKTCRVISKKNIIRDESLPGDDVDTFLVGFEYIYEDFGVVYVYRLGGFYTLYNFNALVSDSWLVAGISTGGECDSTGEIQITSISDTTIDGTTFDKYLSEPVGEDYWGFSNYPILNVVGSLWYLFPQPSNCLFDYYEGHSLRCYYNNEIGFIHFDDTTDCDFIPVEIKNDYSFENIRLFPNPASNSISITSNETPDLLLDISNISGSKLIENIHVGSYTNLDLTNFPSGIYLFRFHSSRLNLTFKIIKE